MKKSQKKSNVAANNFLKEFKNKRILVTGGTGSIGSKIVKELLKYQPRQIRVFSRGETKQFYLHHDLAGVASGVNFLIGDIRDKERLNMAMENIDIVFHAAALKHVPACEKNPFEAVKTNVHGTQNVIHCAYDNNVDKVIMISTDKATDPANVMGCTKLLAEKLILSSFLYKGSKKTKFCCIRFGNVLGSRGSVVPLFIKQIKQGGPLTITDPNMTRFFMSTSQAVQLAFKASKLMRSREIFVLKMPALSIGDLAQAVVDICKEKNNLKNDIPIKIIGRKGGEKIHEKLMTIEESEGALDATDMFIIVPGLMDPNSEYACADKAYLNAKKMQRGEYSSVNVKKLSVEEIKNMLLTNGDLEF